MLKKILTGVTILVFIVLSGLFFAGRPALAADDDIGLLTHAVLTEENEIVFERIGDEKIPVKSVLIGDSYAEGTYSSDRRVDPLRNTWPVLVAKQTGIIETTLFALGGTGVAKTYAGRDFLTLLEGAHEKTEDPNEVEWVVVCGGYNDQFFDSNAIYDKMVSFIRQAKMLFPSAKILIGMIGWNDSSQASQDRLRTKVLPAYQKAAADEGAIYLLYGEDVLKNQPNSIGTDHVHPTLEGQTALGDHISFFMKNQYGPGREEVYARFYPDWDSNLGSDVVMPYRENEEAVFPEWVFEGQGERILGWTRYSDSLQVENFSGDPVSNLWIWENAPYVNLYAVYPEYGDEEGHLLKWNDESGQWQFFTNGEPDDSYTGLFSCNGRLFYIRYGVPDEKYNGLVPYKDELYFVRNGKHDPYYSGIIKYGADWWRVVNGKVDVSCNSVENNEYGWWKITNGKVDFNFRGFARNANGWWYLENGKVSFAKNDVIYGTAHTDPGLEGEPGWWLVRGSRVTNAKTIARIGNDWWFVRDGKVDFSCDSVENNENGWWKITGGRVDFNFRGFARNANGWWYLENGKVSFAKNDVIYGTAHTDPGLAGEPGWWLVRGSRVTNAKTIARVGIDWWFVRDGRVDFSCNSVENNENGWWKVTGGRVDFNFHGFARNANGWWYLENGKVSFAKNDVIYGTAHTDPGLAGEPGWWLVRGSRVTNAKTVARVGKDWWFVRDGRVDFSCNSVEKNENGWWKITNGKVDFYFRGLAKNDNGWWYLENGKVNFSYNGTVVNENGTWNVVNGKVVF